VQRSDGGEVVGYCGLIPNSHGQDGEPEIAYELLRRFWGRGYATESARAVVAWARESGYERLWSTVRAWNAPSRRVMDRLGFAATPRIEADAVHGDTIFYTLAL
jgi:[ribosomal protein S5]-alanine N-acetyltransferase